MLRKGWGLAAEGDPNEKISHFSVDELHSPSSGTRVQKKLDGSVKEV